MAELNDMTPKIIQTAQKECKELLEKHYYPAWDSGVGQEARVCVKRNHATGVEETHSKLFFLYRAGAKITWNGTEFGDVSFIDSLVQQMLDVKTKHTLKTLDVQPIIDEYHFLCTATGQCRYNDEVTRGFSQVFIVWKDKQQGTASPMYVFVFIFIRISPGL